MLKTGREYLAGLRDGRRVYIANERVKDVTTHPALCNTALTIASLYDFKADPANLDAMSFSQGDGVFSMYYLVPKSRMDLCKRMETHRRIAAYTYGLFGRSPDHVASAVTGLFMNPDVLDEGTGKGFSRNLINYYYHMRNNDLFAAYAVVPHHSARNSGLNCSSKRTPALRVVREDDQGIVISGIKMLATAAVFSDELWLGNLQPIAQDRNMEAITCAVPCSAAGLALWLRKPLTLSSGNEFDAPLSWRFDESDSMVVCEEVKVPWERVFSNGDPRLSSEMYIRTPSHTLANHQSNVRFWCKLRFLVGLASKIARATGSIEVPAVKETLGRLAGMEAALAGLIRGQIEDCESLPRGFVSVNRRFVYAALSMCSEMHPTVIDTIRDLSGAGALQFPSSVSVTSSTYLRRRFETLWSTDDMTATDRLKLFKLAWDITGSEFAGRHQQYEKFFAGPSHIIRGHSFREAPWENFHRIVDEFMDGYGFP